MAGAGTRFRTGSREKLQPIRLARQRPLGAPELGGPLLERPLGAPELRGALFELPLRAPFLFPFVGESLGANETIELERASSADDTRRPAHVLSLAVIGGPLIELPLDTASERPELDEPEGRAPLVFGETRPDDPDRTAHLVDASFHEALDRRAPPVLHLSAAFSIRGDDSS